MARKVLLAALLVVCACGPDRETSEVVRGGAPEVSPGARDGAGPAAGQGPGAVLFLGTSLTAGLGVDPDEAYPALIQQRIDEAGYRMRVVNAGVSGETSAGGLRRLEWLLRQPVAVLVVELGANDGLRGLATDAMRRNLQEIIDRTRATHPDVRIVIAGMEAPPNMGRQYTSQFRRVFPELARANHAALVPFLLDGVAGRPELNQADGIHPTARGHERIARTLWPVLQPVLAQLHVARQAY